jgi:triosephosphate isomerase
MFYFGTNTKQQLSKSLHEDVAEIASLLAKANKDTQFFVLPALPLVGDFKKLTFGSGLWIGSQRVSGKTENITGEISAQLLNEIDADMVMVGHAERRALGENQAEINRQLSELIKNKLQILYCVGEEKIEKKIENRKEFLVEQLKVIKDLEIEKAILAYEPVWAIGVNGTPAEPNYVEESMNLIKIILKEMGKDLNKFPVLFGGSVNIENAKAFAALKSCDGLFVGRSAWSKDGFRNVYEKARAGFKSKE